MKEAQALRALAEELATLPEVQRELGPVPLEAFFAEAASLEQIVKLPEVRSRLVAVGMDAAKLDKLGTVLLVAQDAQAEWLNAKGRSYSSHLVELIDRAHAERSELLAAARFHLGDSVLLTERLGTISEGEVLEDLMHELLALCHLIEQNARAFARDTTFDARARARAARELALALQQTQSEERFDAMQRQVRERRDRSYTLLATLVEDARRAGRYAFRGDPAILPRFRGGSEVIKSRKRRVALHAREEEGEATLVPPAAT